MLFNAYCTCFGINLAIIAKIELVLSFYNNVKESFIFTFLVRSCIIKT